MSSPYRFGECELHVADRRLLIGGAPATVGGRAFEVLRVLVEQRARPVPKDELLDIVWPGQFVEEGNLPVQVSSLRKLLGPQSIATVPGRGYRFSLYVHGDDALAGRPQPGREVLPAAAPGARPARSNLPLQTTHLLGRDDDLAQLQAGLAGSPLLSVVGASGIGKTRLALAAAQSQLAVFDDGVWWVDLGDVLDADLLLGRIAQALGLSIERASDPAAALIDGLRKLQLLVVLDNCEHLLDRLAPLVQAAVSTAPNVRWLLTSLEPLKLASERVLRLAPLAVPAAGTPLAEALRSGALALLVERARAADRRFTLTTAQSALAIEICRQLDGMPLALEMAAARLPWMGVQAVHDRLGERLRMLRDDTRPGSRRHRTLLAAMDWSHALLSASEQAVFRRLAVFRGGFTLHTAPAVVADGHVVDAWDAIDALGGLVDKSMIQIDGDPQARELRYRMLESARLFAQERLDASGEGRVVRERHAEVMAAFAQTWSERLWNEPDVVWLAATEPEADNLRFALATALDTALEKAAETAAETALDDGAAARQAAARVAPLFDQLSWIAINRSGGAELRRWAPRVESLLGAAEATATAAIDPLVAARLRLILGGVWRNTAPAHALEIWHAALARPRAAGDSVLRFRLACCAATSAARIGRTDEAAAQWGDARAQLRADWSPRLRLLEADAAGFVAHFAGDSAAARGHFGRFRDLALQAGADGGLMVVSHNLADIALSLGEVDEAVRIGRELVAWLRTQRSPYNLGFALGNLFAALVQQEDAAAALATGAEALAMLRRDENAVWLFDHFALLAARCGRAEDAARLLGYADKARAATGTPRDTSEAQACERARALADGALGAALRERLGAEGATLDDAQADRLATQAGLGAGIVG